MRICKTRYVEDIWYRLEDFYLDWKRKKSSMMMMMMMLVLMMTMTVVMVMMTLIVVMVMITMTTFDDDSVCSGSTKPAIGSLLLW